MFETIRHIEYLLMGHDCVSVPGLGAFVSQYVPAEINRETGLVTPPRRVFSFNQVINYDDGLLNASIARRNRVDYSAAAAIVSADVRAILTQLDGVGDVALGRVGVLRKKRSGAIEFQPAERYSMSPALTAMSPVALPGAGVGNTLKIVRRRSADSLMFKVASIAASIVMMVMLAVSLTTPIIPDNAVKASLGITSKPAARPVAVDFNPAIDLAIAMPDPSTSVADIARRPGLDDMNYFVVVASLVNHDDAQSFIDSYGDSGVNFSILDGDAHCRVVVAAAQNLPELAGQLASWREQFPQAWIYQRK